MPYKYTRSANPWLARRGNFPKQKVLRGVYGKYSGKIRRVGYYGRYNRRGYPGLGGELKFKDISLVVDPIAVAGSLVTTVNTIEQGADENERIGRKVIIKSIHIRGRFKVDDATANGSTTIIRMIIYVDGQANGAAAAALDMMHIASNNSFRSLVNTGRFKFLLDKQIVLNKLVGGYLADDTTSNQAVQKQFIWNKRVHIPLLYDGATGALTELCCNNVGILFFTDLTASAPSFAGNLRLRFEG